MIGFRRGDGEWSPWPELLSKLRQLAEDVTAADTPPFGICSDDGVMAVLCCARELVREADFLIDSQSA